LSDHRVVKAMLKEMEIPHFVEVSVFEDENLIRELKALKEEFIKLSKQVEKPKNDGND
jgi:hypothetical protein